jgi:diguanylate cyclase (GGDEF)-like protein/PAS domain S-box-containing protein
MMDLEQYRLIVEASPNMIWRSNLSTECDYFNKTWLDFTGHTMEEEYGFGWAKGVHPDDFDRCVKIYLENFKAESPFEMDYRLMRHDGQYRWINDRGVPFYNDNKEFIGFIGSCMDITEKIEGQLLKELAQTDELCKTYNRQYSNELLAQLFAQAKNEHCNFALLMMDIDDFKQINDQYGHPAGDTVLAQVANVAKNEMRNWDILGRYGGDEFVVGLYRSDLDTAKNIAERIRSSIEAAEFILPDTSIVKVSVSVGTAILQNDLSLEELIERADKKLYDAKHNGKNIVTY